jgi:hypothetical protein
MRAGNRTHRVTEEVACTRLGFLRLTKRGQASSDADRVFAELSLERFIAHAPPRFPAYLMRYAKLSSTARLKSVYTPPTRLPLAQHSLESLPTSLPDKMPKPAKRLPTNAEQHKQK